VADVPISLQLHRDDIEDDMRRIYDNWTRTAETFATSHRVMVPVRVEGGVLIYKSEERRYGMVWCGVVHCVTADEAWRGGRVEPALPLLLHSVRSGEDFYGCVSRCCGER
jgi:hypothetical protein